MQGEPIEAAAPDVEQRLVILWSTASPKNPPLQFTVDLAAPLDSNDPSALRAMRDSLVDQVLTAVGLRFGVACTSQTHAVRLWDGALNGFAKLNEFCAPPPIGPIKAALQPLTAKPTPRVAPVADEQQRTDTPPVRPPVSKRSRLDQRTVQPSPLTAAVPKAKHHAASDWNAIATDGDIANALSEKLSAKIAKATEGQSSSEGSPPLPSTVPFGPRDEDKCRASGRIAAVGLASAFWLPPPQVRHDAVLMEFPLKTVDVQHEDAANCIPSPRALGDLIGLL